MTDTESGTLDSLHAVLLCYCTNLTIGDVRDACRLGQWPLPGKERTGKLCTGCLGDLNHLLRRFAAEARDSAAAHDRAPASAPTTASRSSGVMPTEHGSDTPRS